VPFNFICHDGIKKNAPKNGANFILFFPSNTHPKRIIRTGANYIVFGISIMVESSVTNLSSLPSKPIAVAKKTSERVS